MKKGALLVLVLLLMPIAFAEITITTDQHIYNLGNKIKASASVLQPNNFEGLFKLTISCGNYNLQYFLTPVNLEASFRTAVNAPELAAKPPMLSNCTITGSLLTNDNIIVEESNSKPFSITSQLTVLPVNSKVISLPGDTLLVSGVVNEAFGNNVLKASVKIMLGNNTYSTEAIDGKFNFLLELQENIKSGKHDVEIIASDSKLNSGTALISLEITAVPTYIKNEVSAAQLQPGSKVEITSSLYDQADDLINATLDLELTAPSGSKVFRKVVQSNEKLEYEFSQYAEPGYYLLLSSYKNLSAKSDISISTVREVKIRYENETVFVENIGNVVFEDELTFLLESDSKKYAINKKIKVEPGKTLSIDLSKEVPLGIYDVMLPAKEGLEPIKEKVNETLQSVIESTQQSLSSLLPNENVLASDVTIHDNRPIYKKIVSGISSISGTLVGANGLLTNNPLIAPMILLVILLLIIFRYGRKPIMSLIKGKKDDEGKKN